MGLNSGIINQFGYFGLVLQFMCVNMKEQEDRGREVRKIFHCFCLVENDVILMVTTCEYCKEDYAERYAIKSDNSLLFSSIKDRIS